VPLHGNFAAQVLGNVGFTNYVPAAGTGGATPYIVTDGPFEATSGATIALTSAVSAGWGPIALIGSTGGGSSSSQTTTGSTVPAAVQGLTDPNTLLLWTVAGVAVAIADIPTPSGWSVWQANTAASTNFKVVTFYRFASAEPASYGITGLTSGRYASTLRVYSGVDATNPQDVAVTTSVSTTAMATPASITPVTNGAWIDCTNDVVTASGVTTTTWTSSNMTKDIDYTSTVGSATNAAGGTAHQAWSSGAFTPVLTQATSTASRGIAITSALRPASLSSIALTDAVTSDGVVGAVAGAALALAVAVSSAGVVGTSTGSSVSETATVASAGTVALSTDASVPLAATVSAAGQVGLSSGSSVSLAVAVTSAGVVGVSSGSAIALTATVQSSWGIQPFGTPTASGSPSANSTGTGSLANPASGVTDPNLLLLVTITGAAASIADIATPSGWSVWAANTSTGTAFKSVTFYRFASSEPATYTFNGFTTGKYATILRAYSYVDPTSPQDVTLTTSTSTTGTPSPAAITPATPGAWVEVTNSCLSASGVTTTTWTSSNMTKSAEATSTVAAATNVAEATAYQLWTSGAFTPDLTQATSTAARGVSFTSALRPWPDPSRSSGVTIPLTATVTAAGVVGTSTGATIPLTDTVASVGAVGTPTGSTVPLVATVTATGAVGVSTGSAIALTATLSSLGVVGELSTDTIPLTVTISAAGSVVGGALTAGSTLSETTNITSAGVVGAVAGSTVALTDTVTSAGFVATSTGASVPLTATVTAAGVVATFSGATLSETVTVTSVGVVARSTGSSIPLTASVTSAGIAQVVTSQGASLPLTDAVTTAGQVGTATGSSIPATVALTAAGLVAKATTAALSETVAVSASGFVGTATDATVALTAAVTADGTAESIIAHADADHTLVIPAEGRTYTASTAGRTYVVAVERRQLVVTE
jgi:hypothetical protein